MNLGLIHPNTIDKMYSSPHVKRSTLHVPKSVAAKLVASATRLVTLTVMAQASDVVSPSAAGAARTTPKGKQAPTPVYPERVLAILNYLEANPMRLQSIPMMYEADVSSGHLPAVIQGLTPADVMPPPSQRRSTDAVAADHFARVVAGLLYVACGGLDQAHNLVTPLCWGAPTPYAGKPITGSPAAQDASYVHALLHRSEGLNDGEFGSGFSNANYSAADKPQVAPWTSVAIRPVPLTVYGAYRVRSNGSAPRSSTRAGGHAAARCPRQAAGGVCC
ncbi:hypothetical protein VaNZ11_016449 [Volvox africanus]|uniref:RNase III domain-containing protein n=1 Tax=Volvox africanus TaxID=51714 RepID=A0ABQ5SMX0_9CHLO|nr:hypothetical protein VaNZ11_016449 [Volvox africanus]